MLSYKAPFLETGNLTVFTDDTNPDVFYYVCVQPSIALDDSGKPKIDAYAILPESGVGLENSDIQETGLMLDVCLAVPETTLEAAKKDIRKKLGADPRILVPAPIHSGKVYLIVAAAGEEPAPEKWFITSEVKPSIFGNNFASLVVRATGNDAKLLVAALNADLVAASVYYELEMLGIAPVFKASMRVNWNKIYHHFESFDKSNFIFYTDEITETVDRLAETSAIEMDIQELDPEIKSEALKTLLNELKTEVLSKLFKPASSPLSASRKWEERLVNGISRTVAAIFPGVHHIRRQIDEEHLSTTTVQLSQKNVKKYPFYPQALLTSMIKAVGGIKDGITWIKLDDLPFFNQRVEIRLSADTFKNTNIKSVYMECRVIDVAKDAIKQQQTIVFETDDQLDNHFDFNREKGIEYRYDYKATLFMTTDSNKLPGKLEIDWRSEKSPYLYFNAAEYFETNEIRVHLDDSSVFEHTQLIEAELFVLDKNDQSQILRRTFLFKPQEENKQVLSVVSNKLLPVQFDLQLKYYISASKEHTASYTDVNSDYFFIPNPFENKWSTDLICHANWEQTAKIILETRISDTERTDPVFNKFEFKPDSTASRLIAATSLDTPRESFEYRVTVLTAGSDIVQGPWQTHGGPILVITDRILSERIIRATLTEAPDFVRKEIKSITVEFKYNDNANNISIESTKLPLKEIGSMVEFRHPMPDFNHKDYIYRIQVRGRTDVYRSDWITANKEKIDIIIPQHIW